MRSHQKKKKRISYSQDSFSSKVLNFIEEITGVTYIAFSRESLIRKLNMDPAFEGHRLIKTLCNLEKSGFIKKKKDRKYHLTPKGLDRISFSKILNLSLNKNRRDGFWRVVIFDIPEEERVKRNLLRNKLKEFDFYMIQKSVFVSPYNCEKEIKKLCEFLNLKNEVCIFLTKDLSFFEENLREYYS